MSLNTFPQTVRKPRAKYQLKYLLGLACILGVIGYLIFFGISNTQQYYKKVGELLSAKATLTGQGVRVGGNLVPSSIDKDITKNKISFVISDGSSQLPVSYEGAVPDTFDKATEVIAEGKLNPDGTFTASLVLAKCPSKYDAASIPPSDYQWQTFANK
jgi:cytochrome c-type biogenesis protein CcmE